MENIIRALEKHRKRLHAFPNVVAVGIGYKVVGGKKTSRLGIICSVEKKLPVSELAEGEIIPAEIEGIVTDVVETGIIRAIQTHTDRIRPAIGGISIGHKDISAGTFGCLTNYHGKQVILSNNHVLANSNEAKIGDPILQPGTYDGGVYPLDHIANLEAFIPIVYAGSRGICPISSWIVKFLNMLYSGLGRKTRFQIVETGEEENVIDIAVAAPVDAVSPEIMEVGLIQGKREGLLGMKIKKSGRTTGLTFGEIEQVNVSVNVSYGNRKTAYFVDQFLAGAMCDGGDSGSIALDEDNYMVGLLFAGSDTTTLFNPVRYIDDWLEGTI